MVYELRSARYIATDCLRQIVRPGDHVIDATMGNGHDTLMLAQLVGETGHVTGFDVQEAAVASSRRLLEENGMLDRCTLHVLGHQHMAEVVTGPVRAVMFNLGWLPGAQHIVTTKTNTTLEAVKAAADLLLPGGIMTICIYPGHEEGMRELAALLDWASGLDVRTYNVLHHHFICARPDTPRLILVQKNL